MKIGFHSIMPAATFAMLASQTLDISITFMSAPILLLVLPYILDRKNPNLHSRPLTMFTFLWVGSILFAALFTEVENVVYGVIRFTTLSAYLVLIHVSFRQYSNKVLSIVDFMKMALFSCFLFIASANVIDPSIPVFPFTLFYERYLGTGGPNLHGFIAVLGFIFVLSIYFFRTNSREINLFSLALAGFFLYNALIAGSRASLFSLLFFLSFMALSLFKIGGKLMVTALLALISIFVFTNLNELSGLFKFDEPSTEGRVAPLLFGIQMITNQGGMPFGLGNLRALLELTRSQGIAQALDNLYLGFTIELGAPAIVILSMVVLLPIYMYRRYSCRMSSEQSRDYLICLAIIQTIHFEALFENMFFSGFSLSTLTHILLFSIFLAAPYFVYTGMPSSLDGQPV